MGVAVRAYYESPATTTPGWSPGSSSGTATPAQSDLLPGYGWIFGVGDGTANVGLGILNTSHGVPATSTTRTCCAAGSTHTPAEWGFRDENLVGRIGSAALPMGFNRKPHYTRGMLLVGDSGGMVNPFNGEGIDYALEAGHLAAEIVVQALARPEGAAPRAGARGLPPRSTRRTAATSRWAGSSPKMIGNPTFMKQATRYGLPRTALMKFTLKLMANLTDPHDGDVVGPGHQRAAKVAPAA